ncbi:response regulator [Maridesulfovibrio sp. FT414]|uniref:response regulator n=1 Tax=Maridesulfovibrio sp. FT414 TaxID=2979469 RepID=UPI003D806F44
MSKEASAVGSDRPSKVLVVEDSITFSGILKRSIQDKLDVEVVVCPDYAQAKECLERSAGEFFMALLDIVLPDAPNGEVVDMVVASGIPSVVFTGEISDALRSSMWAKRIIDFVPKGNFDDIQHVVTVVDRLRKNIFKKVLVVDDSSTSRSLCRELLQAYNYEVVEAANGRDALSLVKNGDVDLVISDCYMPKMDGPAFVKEVRRSYSKAKLPIIGFSGSGGASTSAEFLKSGANDFITKPFVPEEFYCRVSNTVDTAEYIKTITSITDNDSLTGLYTLNSFYKYGEKLFAQQKRSQSSLVSVLIDIDGIGELNDKYGPLIGDDIIRQVGGILRNRFRMGDVVSRYGADVFCILCADMKLEHVDNVFHELADKIAATRFVDDNDDVRVTVSIGINTQVKESLEKMVLEARKVLLEAKSNGPGSVFSNHV